MQNRFKNQSKNDARKKIEKNNRNEPKMSPKGHLENPSNLGKATPGRPPERPRNPQGGPKEP